MSDHTPADAQPEQAEVSTGPPPGRRAHFELFLVSFALLFFELACIRWFGSTVVYLTFFTNFVLMACILGMSVGCLVAGRSFRLEPAVIPLALVTALMAVGLLRSFERGEMSIDVGNQSSPQQVYFGTESQGGGSLASNVPVELIAGAFFALISLTFIGMGQALGRALAAEPNRVVAYTTNIAGSLAGIVAFAAASYARTPPPFWFAVGLLPMLWFAWRWRVLQLAALVALVVMIGRAGPERRGDGTRVLWSPYYKVVYHPDTNTIDTNNIGHQSMVKVAASGAAYALPYLMNRDAGGNSWRDVMIIGAGSGNDVQAALSHGVEHVDGVEIDPVMYELGRAHHPDRPYDDPRVAVHLDDGRSFLRASDRSYDAVVYALVDSLVLHSGYSSLRLESFLFTEQAFREIRDRLKPDGVFIMYNYFRRGFVVGRIAKMAERVFGTRPIVISLPYRKQIDPDQDQAGAITLIMVGRSETALEPIRARLERESFWAHVSPRKNEGVNAYGAKPPDVPGLGREHWRQIGMSEVGTAGITRVPTDDWPFLYLRSPTVPWLNVRGMLIVTAVSLAILRLFAPTRTIRPNGRMFFLGAGFMLLETKGVVHLALLFGSTWVVNSIVFFAILVMILLSNLYVLLAKPRRLWPFYALLMAGLLANIAVPMTWFLTLPGTARVVVSCAVVFVPIFFAGVIFATAFRASVQPDVDLGWNIAGVLLGGLSEYLSLVVGFNALLVLAMLYYALSALLAGDRNRSPAIARAVEWGKT
ncbi:MAG: methyltransferase domain-containing protein [Isosphaeraceae bacterium]|nr:methyltransferase domain-containing protein [Isosphaeraceae bacterium]